VQVTAVVPLKALEQAKQRLATALDPAARRGLVTFMASRVLDACVQAPSVRRVLAIAGDEQAASVLQRSGVKVIVEPRPGLGRALDRAGTELAGDEASLVIHADLPLARAADVEAVCRAATRTPCVVVVPSRDGGTAALLRSPATIISQAFGPGSSDAHLQLAAAARVTAVRLAVPNLAVDIDDHAGLMAATVHEPALGRWAEGREPRDATTLHADNHVR
jgi:2-phospho-L-lactate/phosphoenolpyruvate guanylyltransferase